MTHKPERNIVVGVEDSEHSQAAVDLAVAEANRRHLPLHLLSAHPPASPGNLATTLTETLRRVCSSWPGLAVAAQNVTGDPAEALIDASRGAELVVVGRRPGGGERPAPGSTAAQVAAHSLCPTLVAPADAPAVSDAPVLVGLGMSADDEPAIGFAFAEAALREVPLRAVHVWSGVPAQATFSPFAYELGRAQDVTDHQIAESLSGWAGKYPDVTVERMPLYDLSPARTLLDASALAGLVVVGARRDSRHSTQLLGSVTRMLVERSGSPVAIIRPMHH